MRKLSVVMTAALVGLAIAGAAGAANIPVNANIAVSETWTKDNVYDLQQQIYVLPGATLTIEAGTLIQSTANIGGSLAVSKGAQIIACGTAQEPIIFTSTADDLSTWQELANTWGNLTIMGDGYISEDATPGNVPTCNANNVAAMEGLIEDFPGDPKILYGGGNDDDDSGSLCYVSFRYGGRVIGLNDELNGLSLGGIGRGTDIHHVEIMNNVDDGIEVWGGTVNLKYLSIWNIGDDSLDIDQGWRGQAQYVLIVQGYSADADQGSGVGDNCIETDGAENSDWQPVTTTSIYNATIIGQPVDGDGATAWRDNARVQYRNCIIMDCGEKVVRFDNLDGDGAQGYGFNGTLSWPDTWTTSWLAAPSHANDCPNPEDVYRGQFSGNLAEISDTVFFRNLGPDAYTEANDRGVFDAANNNVLIAGSDPAASPIKSVTRRSPVTKGGKTMVLVDTLDPRPMNEALEAVNVAPNNGFYSTEGYTRFRGAVDPANPGWYLGWTAASAFGFTPDTLLTFDAKLGNNGPVVYRIIVKKNTPRTATVIDSVGNVLCCDVPLNLVSSSPLTGEFDCDGTTFQVIKDGGLDWTAGNFGGRLKGVAAP